jgi:hypothetical protein
MMKYLPSTKDGDPIIEALKTVCGAKEVGPCSHD